jgi:hypothetical protein
LLLLLVMVPVSRQQGRSSERRKKGSTDRKRGRGSMWGEVEDTLYDGDTLANAVKWRLMQVGQGSAHEDGGWLAGWVSLQ